MNEINLINGAAWKRDSTTVYEIADATKLHYLPVTPNCTINIQMIWAGLTGTLDGTLIIQSSDTGVPAEFDSFSNATFTLDSASGSNTWTKTSYNAAFVGVAFTQNNLNLAGTIKLKLVIKKNLTAR